MLWIINNVFPAKERQGIYAQLVTVQSNVLPTMMETAYENIVRKGENVGIQHFLLLP